MTKNQNSGNSTAGRTAWSALVVIGVIFGIIADVPDAVQKYGPEKLTAPWIIAGMLIIGLTLMLLIWIPTRRSNRSIENSASTPISNEALSRIPKHVAAGIRLERDKTMISFPTFVYDWAFDVRADFMGMKSITTIADQLLQELPNSAIHRNKVTNERALKMLRKLRDHLESYLHAIKTNEHEISLSNEAARILIVTAQSKQGRVIVTRSSSGFVINVGNNIITQTKDPREEAKYRTALKQLLEADLITQTDTKGQVFGVTENGFRKLGNQGEWPC